MSRRKEQRVKTGRRGEYSGPICGARTRAPSRRGRPCRKPAGWGTGHLGYGPCRLHGGSTRAHVMKAAVDQIRDEMPVPVLVRRVDRDAIRSVGLAVISGLDLDVAQQVRARELLDHGIAALSFPIKAKEARRIARQAKADAEVDEITEREEALLEELSAHPVIQRRRKKTTARRTNEHD
jgi:hypothetical protein